MSGITSFLSRFRRLSSRSKSPVNAEHRPGPPNETDFRMLAESSNDVICRMGADMIAVYVSPAVERVFGWTAQEMMEGGSGGFIHPDDAEQMAHLHEALIDGQQETSKASFRILRKDGTAVWVEGNARVVRDDPTAQPEVVIVMRDISDRKRLEDELLALSLTDALTGLGNRRAFDETLAREWDRTSREGSQMSLLLLDIDHFKSFNDLYGHQAGDDCLRMVALAIKQAVARPGDLVARYGGEEIAVVLPNTGAGGAEVVAERIRRAVEALAVHHEGNVNEDRTVTASIGVATAFSRVGGSIKMPEGLLLSADNALYKAKYKGRNCVSATVLLVAREDVP